MSEQSSLPEDAASNSVKLGSVDSSTLPKTTLASFFSHISITQLTLAVMVVIFLWQWLDERRIINDMQQQMAKKINEMDSGNKANSLLLMQNQQQISELSAKAAATETHYAEAQDGLYSDSSVNRDETVLAEVEQMLLNAAQQLQLSANVRAALIFMHSADARLQHMNRPAFRGLRRAISQDMDQLRVLPSVDVAGINRQLDELMAAVDELPLANQQRVVGEPTSQTISSADKSVWQSLLREIWQEAKQLVQIENTGKDEIPLLPPNQQFFLRENLKLRLLSARIALLSRDEEIFRQELKAIQHWTLRYFDTQSTAGSAALAELKKLAKTKITVEMPGLNLSLQTVRNHRLTSESATR